MDRAELVSRIKGGLIVSCQALPEEPLHSPFIMARMAVAAARGGACGIRASSVADILAIREAVSLPVIGITKTNFPGCEVFITPTEADVDALVETGVELIAMDATARPRPGGEGLAAFFGRVRAKYPRTLFMADCSTYEEALAAQEMGFDFVGTTLVGYTAYTRGQPLPPLGLLRRLVAELAVPVIAEGGVWTPEQLREVYAAGVTAAVVGTAITRPMEITRRFISISGAAPAKTPGV